MCTLITHGIVGYGFGRMVERSDTPRRFAALCAVAAMAPDADLVLYLLGFDTFVPMEIDGVVYQVDAYHRGATHSLLFAPLFAVILAWIARRWTRRSMKPSLTSQSETAAQRETPHSVAPPRSWLWLTAMFTLATLSHSLLDAMTRAGRGIQFFLPLSDTRMHFPWRPFLAPDYGIHTLFTTNTLKIYTPEILLLWLPAFVIVWLRGRDVYSPGGQKMQVHPKD